MRKAKIYSFIVYAKYDKFNKKNTMMSQLYITITNNYTHNNDKNYIFKTVSLYNFS